VPIRVLIVDDVPEVRRMLRTALRFRTMFEIVGEASDGAEAIECARGLQPDIVVLDLGLPDLAGRQVLTRIRGDVPGVKVVVFSGTEPAESEGIAEAVDGYALKDGHLDYLVELLETVGQQRGSQASLELEAHVESARLARRFVRETLVTWGVAADSLDDALLVVSELVTNAVVHARTDCELRLGLSPGSVRIEVVDGGGGTPDPLPPSRTRPHGRGLNLIDAVTSAWGVDPRTGGGKLVWAEIPRRVVRT
jgi:CheY-like chemotaxis protein/anti-sigma regulatory factor (Ser/Thr protein kinase)